MSLVAQPCLTLCDPMDCSPPGSSVHGDSLGKNTGVGCMPSSRGSSQSRDQTQVSHIAGIFFTVWATKEAQLDFIKIENFCSSKNTIKKLKRQTTVYEKIIAISDKKFFI